MQSRLRLLAVSLLVGCLASLARAAEPPKPATQEDLFSDPTKALHRFDDSILPGKERFAEVTTKLKRLRAEMSKRKLDGVVVTQERNFGWISGGGSSVVRLTQRESPVKLLITPDRQYLIANNIEGPRVGAEELTVVPYEWIRYDWYGSESEVLLPLLKGKRIAWDVVPDEYREQASGGTLDFNGLYFPITQAETKKLRWLGNKVALSLERAADQVKPGMTEWDIQYLVSRELTFWNIQPTVLLTAVDERLVTYKHPAPVGQPLHHYVGLNVCGRRWGLMAASSRFVYFGTPDAKLMKLWQEVPKVNAAMWAATQAPKPMGDVIAAAEKAYTAIGYRDEWKQHHQGGPILTQERLWLVKPGDKTRIEPGMVFAWNPSVRGVKCEDTVLLNDDGTLENLTAPIRWPTVSVRVGRTTYKSAGLLVRPGS